MAGPHVRALESTDLPALSELLAARFARARDLEKAISPRALDPRACLGWLEKLFVGQPGAEGVVATDAGRAIGFALAHRSRAAPTDPLGTFEPPQSAAIPSHGHACDPDADPLELYRALYAALSERWVADGVLLHSIGSLGCERAALEAFADLGFGRAFALALRGVEPLAEPTRADVEIREARPDELDAVLALAAELRRWHASAPMFLASSRDAAIGAELLHRGMFGQPELPYFVAWEGSRAVGLCTFAPTAIMVSAPFRAREVAYLFNGVVGGAARGGGVGAALLQHAFAWLRRGGFQTCALHYLTANPSGRPFWEGHGFRPVEYTLRRFVDPRIGYSERAE